MADDNPQYSIGVVERLTGLTARRLRYYEAEGLLTPQRSEGRQRLYSAADVKRLKAIRSWLEEGLNLRTIRELLLDRPGEGVAPGTPLDEPGFAEEEESDAPLRLRSGLLTSLYPVSNQAALERALDKFEKEDQDR